MIARRTPSSRAHRPALRRGQNLASAFRSSWGVNVDRGGTLPRPIPRARESAELFAEERELEWVEPHPQVEREDIDALDRSGELSKGRLGDPDRRDGFTLVAKPNRRTPGGRGKDAPFEKDGERMLTGAVDLCIAEGNRTHEDVSTTDAEREPP